MSSALVKMYQIPVEPSSTTRSQSDTFRHLLDMKGMFGKSFFNILRAIRRDLWVTDVFEWRTEVGHPTVLVMPARSRAWAARPLPPFR